MSLISENAAHSLSYSRTSATNREVRALVQKSRTSRLEAVVSQARAREHRYCTSPSVLGV
ncbi:hypothetical protein [Pseudomonas sp. zfem002]|uniref:hypothetical protein n=1 Tax=Pseudomonas sp. zfem002 TaxID=3078197 RepID=UPI003977E40D